MFVAGLLPALNPGLATRAKLPAVDRMSGISLELLRQPHLNQPDLVSADNFRFTRHHAHQQATPRRTVRAHPWFPGGDAGDEVFFRDEPDKLMLRLPAAVERRRCSSYRRNFDKVATIHGNPELQIRNQKIGRRTLKSELRTPNSELQTSRLMKNCLTLSF